MATYADMGPWRWLRIAMRGHPKEMAEDFGVLVAHEMRIESAGFSHRGTHEFRIIGEVRPSFPLADADFDPIRRFFAIGAPTPEMLAQDIEARSAIARREEAFQAKAREDQLRELAADAWVEIAAATGEWVDEDWMPEDDVSNDADWRDWDWELC